MKQLLFIIAAVAVVYSANAQTDKKTDKTKSQQTTPSKGKTGTKSTTKDNSVHSDWQTCPDNYWTGKDNTYYKIESGKVMSSKDGETWVAVENNVWQDAQGRWIMLKEEKLVWSEDEGKTWSDVPEGKWQGANGTWYKLDKNQKLMIAKDKNKKTNESEAKSKSGTKGNGNGSEKSKKNDHGHPH